jgi:hypothetical protein
MVSEETYSLCRRRIKNFFYPNRTSLLVFSLLSILGINFFADLADGEFDSNNIFSAMGVFIGAPLYLILSSFIYSLVPSWSWTYHNPYFVWVMVPLSFAYLYLISCPVAYLWRWARTADSKEQAR